MLVVVTCGACYALGGKRLVNMTGGTLQASMFAQQRKPGQLVIEPLALNPGVRGMATLTIAPQPASVNIVLGVTSATLGGKLDLACRADVTGLARRPGVFPGQREAGHGIVIEIHRFPSGFGVAARAIGPIAALVRVIGGMAGHAGYGRFGQFGRLLVTTGTGCRAVRALEGESSHPVMVEAHLLPASRAVASGAIAAISALVNVVTGVTGIAGARGMLVGIARTMTR